MTFLPSLFGVFRDNFDFAFDESYPRRHPRHHRKGAFSVFGCVGRRLPKSDFDGVGVIRRRCDFDLDGLGSDLGGRTNSTLAFPLRIQRQN